MPVYRDKERKSWYVSCIYRDLDGVRRHKTKRGFKTKAEAARWEMEFTAKTARDTHMLFRDFVDYYEQDRRPRLRESTWLTKDHIIREKLLPFFGDMKLDEVEAADVVRWQNGLVNHRDGNGKPYSPTYLRTVNNQLSAIFNHAVRYYGLPSSPVAKVGKIGSTKGAEMQFWTREEYLAFAEAIMDKPESYLAFEVLYWTGIREGELLALTPEDFDLDRMTLSVTKSYQRLKRRDVITGPKTPKSVRVVTMPECLRDEVAFYLDDCADIERDERIFKVTKGFLSHEMRRGCEASGIKRIRIHDLRHSHVSLLIELGFSALAIADRLGHESVDVTYRYAHLFPNKQAAMATALDGWRRSMGLSERNLDRDGRFRSRTVAFRMSDAEADRLNQLVAISGLTKQDYITQCLLEREVVVKPSFRVYQKVHREVFKLYDELERLESLDCADSGLRQLVSMLLDELAGFRGSESHEVTSEGLTAPGTSECKQEGGAPIRQDDRAPSADSAASTIIGRFLRRGGDGTEE